MKKRHISSITAAEFEQVIRTVFPDIFNSSAEWRFHQTEHDMIRYHTPEYRHEFMLRPFKNTISFNYFNREAGMKIEPEEDAKVFNELKRLGFDVPRLES